MLSFHLHEPAGVILLYRVSAPRGSDIRASAQLPGVTVPLLITTAAIDESCTERGLRVICTVGVEGCPLPAGTWRFRVEKLDGPAGNVKLWFQVGDPPSSS
jgi:hypothetical protein